MLACVRACMRVSQGLRFSGVHCTSSSMADSRFDLSHPGEFTLTRNPTDLLIIVMLMSSGVIWQGWYDHGQQYSFLKQSVIYFLKIHLSWLPLVCLCWGRTQPCSGWLSQAWDGIYITLPGCLQVMHLPLCTIWPYYGFVIEIFVTTMDRFTLNSLLAGTEK